MASTRARLLPQIQTMLGAAHGIRQLDGQLLERFTTEGDQASFAALVRRHGPMVLNVCRRVLHNAADAEDAFQATFLVLARKAPAIGKRESLVAWLHQVAYRVALRTRTRVAQRRDHEERAAGRLGEDPLAAITGRELLTVLDEELHALPAQSRGPLILCYLEDQTREEAARQLGLSLGTLKRRLEQARALLRRRLERRGLALATAFLAMDSLQAPAKAAVPGLLAATTTKAAVQAAAGKGLAEVASAHIVALVTGTLRAMALGKVIATATLVITMTLAGIGIGFAAYVGQSAPDAPQLQTRSPEAAPSGASAKAEPKTAAPPAEDLPPGALARFGSARFSNIGRVFALAYSPDGRLLASGAWDGSIRIWQTATGKELRTLEAHSGPIQKLAFSPDGKVLASAGRGPGLCLWEVTTGRLIRTLSPDKNGFSEVVFSPDGSKIAGIGGGTLYVWDRSGKELWSQGAKRFYTRCAFRGSDSIVAVFQAPWLTNWPSPYLIRHSFGQSKDSDSEQRLAGNLSYATFGPDGNVCAFRDDLDKERQLSYLPLEHGKSAPPIPLKDLSVSTLCISPDRRMIALSGDSWALEGRASKVMQLIHYTISSQGLRISWEDDTDVSSCFLAVR